MQNDENKKLLTDFEINDIIKPTLKGVVGELASEDKKKTELSASVSVGKSKKKRKKIIVVISVLLLLIAAAVFAWWYMDKGDGSCDLEWGMSAEDSADEFLTDLGATRIGESNIFEMTRVPGMIKADTMVLLNFTENDELFEVQMMTGIGDYSGADLQKKIMKYLKERFGEVFTEISSNGVTYKVWYVEDVVATYSNGSTVLFYNPNVENETVVANNIKFDIPIENIAE